MINFFISSAGIKAVVGLIPIALMPFISKNLGVNGFSEFTMAYVMVSIMVPFVCLNTQTAQRLFSCKKQGSKEGYLLSSLLIISFLLLMCSLVLFCVHFLLESNGNTGFFFLVLCAAASVAVLTSIETYFSTTFNSRALVMFTGATALCIWLSVIIGIYFFKYELIRLVSLVGFSLTSLVIVSSILIKRFSRRLLWVAFYRSIDFIKFSYPLALYSVLNLLLLHLDKLYLTSVVTSPDVSYYIALSQISVIILFVFQSFLFPLEPLLYKNGFKKILPYILLVLIVGLALILFLYMFREVVVTSLIGIYLDIYESVLLLMLVSFYFKGVSSFFLFLVIKMNLQSRLYVPFLIVLLFYGTSLFFYLGASVSLIKVSIANLILNLTVLLYLSSLVLLNRGRVVI